MNGEADNSRMYVYMHLAFREFTWVSCGNTARGSIFHARMQVGSIDNGFNEVQTKVLVSDAAPLPSAGSI